MVGTDGKACRKYPARCCLHELRFGGYNAYAGCLVTSNADPGLTEVYLGGYRSLDSCKVAGVSWLSRSHDREYVHQCRLNCRSFSVV